MRNKKSTFFVTVGLLCVAAALLLIIYNLYGNYDAAQKAESVITKMEIPVPPVESSVTEPENTAEQEVPDYILNPDMDMPVENIEGQDYIGVLEIPALELELPIISEWSYSRLKIAPCRYVGSAYKDDLVIAAHNYKSHFGGLSQLQEGDRVIFTDMDGNIFYYNIVVKEVLNPTAVEEMTSGEFDLTLFTCNYGGSKRVTIRCDKAEN